MTLTQKETSLLKDLRSQEQLCIEKYTKYSEQASDGQLRTLFSQIAQTEREHLKTLDQISSGSIPQMSGGSSQKSFPIESSSSSPSSDKQKDQYLCTDALSTEKFVSADYNTCIFEFRDKNIRDAMNHIQKEEQQHGEQIYNYMSKNGMYQ
jgi:spore coat protein CotF